MPVMMITRICKKEMKDTNMKAERNRTKMREEKKKQRTGKNKRVQVFFFGSGLLTCY